MTSAAGKRRHVQIAMAVVAAALVAVATVYVVAVGRLIQARTGGDRNLLDVGAKANGEPDKAQEAAIVKGLAMNPLNQSALNALFVERARSAARPMNKAEADLLLRLGWRDHVALRNVGEVYADGSDLPKLLDVFDALLRREKVGDPVTTVLEGMETEPRYQAALVNKLAQEPPWRSFFFRLGANRLNSREAVLGRLRTFQALGHTSGPPSAIETAAMLPVLHAQGLGAEAFALWQDQRRRAHQPLFARPLTDPGFVRAARLQESEGVPTVYDWIPEYGDGFSVSFGSDPANLRIDWDGRGVPVFVRQRTSGSPGPYRLTVAAGAETNEGAAIGYRLVCPEVVVDLKQVMARGGTTLYRTDGQVPCAFPLLEVFGRAQDHPRDVQAEIRQVALSRGQPLQG